MHNRVDELDIIADNDGLLKLAAMYTSLTHYTVTEWICSLLMRSCLFFLYFKGQKNQTIMRLFCIK